MLFIGALVLLALGILFLNFLLPISDSRSISIISGVTSSLLSLALLIIYYKMSRTQDFLSELQLDQTEIMREANSPQISFDELRYTGQDNDFHIELSNLGKSAARDLRLQIKPELRNWQDNREQFESSASGWDVGHEEIVLTKTNTKEQGTAVASQGNYIDKGRTNEVFEFSISFTGISQEESEQETSIRPQSLLKRAVLEKTVDEDHEHYEEFNRYAGHQDWLSQTAWDEESGYAPSTWEQLAQDIGFNRLRLRFVLTFMGETKEEESQELADIIVPVLFDQNDGEMWEYAYGYTDYKSKLDSHRFNMGMDPIQDEMKRQEFHSNAS